MSECSLVTGFAASHLATSVALELARRGERIVCVVPDRLESRANEELAKLSTVERARVDVIEGETHAMDLGLSGAEFRKLAAMITRIHHCAALTYPGAARAVAEEANVGGTREVLELAENAPKLARLVHWSTAQVSGKRRGYVLEDELIAPAFHTVIEETRFRAEKLVRESSTALPVTVLRPTMTVGSSRTGEIDRFDGPYVLVLLLLGAPPDLRLPLPARGDAPLNLVPIDYVVEAGLAIAADERSRGRTFHLIDPDPLTTRRVFELLAQATGRQTPRAFLPPSVATTLLRTPGLDRFGHMPREFLEQMATEVVYDDRNTREILRDHHVDCPPFETYVDTLVKFVEQRRSEQHPMHEERSVEADDPLA